MKKTSLNFGAIKETVARKSAVELTRGHNGGTLMKFMESIKKSPTLKKQHYIYKNIETAKPFAKERLAERFLVQNLKVISGENWQNLIKENAEIRKDLLGTPDKSSVVASNEKASLYEAINTLIEAKTNPAFKDFEKEANAYGEVIDHLTREVVEEQKNDEENVHPKFGKFWEYITKDAVSNFNERFSHLNEDEKKLFKILIAEGDQKINYIKALRQNTINTIKDKLSEARSAEDKNVLNEFKEKIEKEVDNATLISDEYIFHIADLNQSLSKL